MRALTMFDPHAVIPAQAGIQCLCSRWMPE